MKTDLRVVCKNEIRSDLTIDMSHDTFVVTLVLQNLYYGREPRWIFAMRTSHTLRMAAWAPAGASVLSTLEDFCIHSALRARLIWRSSWTHLKLKSDFSAGGRIITVLWLFSRQCFFTTCDGSSNSCEFDAWIRIDERIFHSVSETIKLKLPLVWVPVRT